MTGAPAEASDAADDRLVVAEGAIAVQLDEVVDEARDVVERERAQRMARQQHLLPRRQLGEDLALQLARLALEAADLEVELRAAELAAARRSCSRARRSGARSRAPGECRSRAASARVYSTAELVGMGEAARPRLLVEPGALPTGVAARRAEDGVGQGAGGERAVEELADLGVADRATARSTSGPHWSRMRRVSSTRPPASMTSTRAAMRASRRSRGGSSSMTSIGWRGCRGGGARGARRWAPRSTYAPRARAPAAPGRPARCARRRADRRRAA